MFALVDCNNFYVSCERVFQPRLAGRPVVVLSNNDGCVVARSNESKMIGVRMGAPWFEVRDLARLYGIVARSSNYMLYGDMSNRVASVLRGFSPQVEVYSIDESFLGLEGLGSTWDSPTALGQAIRARVLAWTGLPVCVGIAASKTLAKLANHLAKKHAEFGGVCDLGAMPAAQADTLLATEDVGEVWGIGRRSATKLHSLGIESVQALKATSPTWLRAQFGVVMERVASELRGVPCLSLEDVSAPRRQIISSRSFGSRVTALADLREAVTTYTLRAAERLRAQRSACAAIHVHIRTSPFLQEGRRYDNGITVPLQEATDDSRLLTGVALRGLKEIFRPGYEYQKARVTLMEISEREAGCKSLFSDAIKNERSMRLMQVMDALNGAYGRETLTLASAGIERTWSMRTKMRSPRYTTCWDEIPIARAD